MSPGMNSFFNGRHEATELKKTICLGVSLMMISGGRESVNSIGKVFQLERTSGEKNVREASIELIPLEEASEERRRIKRWGGGGPE